MVNDPKAQIYLTKKEIMKHEHEKGSGGSGSVIIDMTSTHIPKTYKTKNYPQLKQKRQRQKERDELEQKFYKYGFWLLLTAGVVNLILTKI